MRILKKKNSGGDTSNNNAQVRIQANFNCVAIELYMLV